MVKCPSLRKRLMNKEVLLGTFQKLNSPAVTEMIGQAGFDFVIIDTEHANFSCGEVENLVRAADSVGLGSIVRVKDANGVEILHALDSGAEGVQIPDLETVEQAEQALRATKYYPLGSRGMSMAQRSAMYGGWNGEQKYVPFSNENSLVVAHVENVYMADHVDELLALPQLDVVFVGPGDLSQSLGKPGQLNDPEVQAVVGRRWACIVPTSRPWTGTSSWGRPISCWPPT